MKNASLSVYDMIEIGKAMAAVQPAPPEIPNPTPTPFKPYGLKIDLSMVPEFAESLEKRFGEVMGRYEIERKGQDSMTDNFVSLHCRVLLKAGNDGRLNPKICIGNNGRNSMKCCGSWLDGEWGQHDGKGWRCYTRNLRGPVFVDLERQAAEFAEAELAPLREYLVRRHAALLAAERGGPRENDPDVQQAMAIMAAERMVEVAKSAQEDVHPQAIDDDSIPF